MSLSVLEGSDFNGQFSTTYQQKKTTESQTKDQWTSQVSVFENAFLGCPKRVEYGKCLKRIRKFNILKPQNRTCSCGDERDELMMNERIMRMFLLLTQQTSAVSCARLLASTCSAFHITLSQSKRMSFWQFKGKPNIYKKISNELLEASNNSFTENFLSNPNFHLNIKTFCCCDNALPFEYSQKYMTSSFSHGINLFWRGRRREGSKDIEI